MKSKLYITCGLPYSGKTCLVDKLVEKFDFIKVSIDDILFSKGHDWDHFDQIGEVGWKKIFNQAENDTKKALKEGKTVIYDSANQDKASRERLKQLAKENGAEFTIIWLNIPLPVLKDRWQRNKSLKERFHLPENLFQAAVDTYQQPSKEDKYIEFNEKDNLEEWIDKYFAK